MRDEFPVAVKEELAKRVGYLCSNPRCKQSTSGPKSLPKGTVNIGVAAHITAAAEGGPRYDDSLTPAKRSSTDNGIWLCQTCAKLVDSDLERYPVDKLREWKSDAEAAAARALERRSAPPTESEGVFLEAQRLMPDLIAEMRTDVREDETQLIRDFMVLPSRGVVLNTRKALFLYFETEHQNLRLQVDWLAEMSAVRTTRHGRDPVYRMVPEFHEWLQGS